MLNYAIGLHALPLQVVVAHHRLSMSQNAIVLAGECALRAPNVSHVALHLDVLILGNVRPATSHDDLELQVANVLDCEVFLADDLSDERVRAAWEDEVMFFAEERLQLVERLRDRLVGAGC